MDALRILAVEDNAADFRLLKLYLGLDPSLPFDVVRASTLKEALDRLSNETFAAALVDLNLPDSNGMESLDRILACAPSLPVIVLTGADNPETGLVALSRRAQDYLVKGRINGDTLIRSLRYAIARSAAEESARRLTVELAHRAADLQRANTALNESRMAALNLMEDALEAREQAVWLARFPEESPEPVLRVSLDGATLYRNPQAAERPGWACEVGQPVPAALAALVRRAVAERQGVEADLEIEGGTYSTAVTLFPAEGYANIYGRDVTERSRAQQAVTRAKREWERTFDSVQDLIAILNTDHRIVRVNRSMAERFGKTPAECVGLTCDEHVHGCATPSEACPHRLTLADGQNHVAEVHVDKLNGDFLVTTSPIRDAEGHLVGAVYVARDITEQKRAEQREQEALSLAAASQTAVDILDAMGEGVLLLDMNGGISSVNPALEKMAGLSAGELVGRPLRDVLPELLSPEDRALAKEAFRAALKGSVPELRPMTLLSRTGRRIPLIPSVTFVHGPGGKPTAIIATLRDISSLRAVQESLEESNALLERIFDNTHLSMAYLNRDFTFVRVNRAYADTWGRKPDFFPGKNHFDLYPQHPENEAIFRRVVETAEPFAITEKPFEFPNHPEWGVTYWDWTVRPLRGDKHHVESLLLCLLDVTPRVRARQGLAESEQAYRELVQNANSIIMRITPDHQITFFNEYAQRFFGYTEDEVLGRNVVGTIVPEMDSEGRDSRQTVREVAQQPDLHASNESENMCKDGRRVWVHWSNRAVRDGRGNLVEWLCVGTDITRRREMEAEARRYQQRLQALAERLVVAEEEDRWRISRYIHDTIIQNLSLSSIRLGSLAQPLTDAKLKEEAGKLRQVRALLDQAIEECRMVMSDLTPALLYELGLIPALNELALRLEAKHGARVLVENDGREKPLSHALRGLIFEAVRELIMNALKHAGPCDIRVAVRCQDDSLAIRVVDNGKGFDPSGAETRSHRQGGFGLFNIRQRLEALGGRLDIDSTPGRGTEATLTLPLDPSGHSLGSIGLGEGER